MHLFVKSLRYIAKKISIICTMRHNWLCFWEKGIICFTSFLLPCIQCEVFEHVFYFAAFKGRDTLNDQLDITQFEEISEVFMPELPKEVIKSYVDTGESM